MNRDLRDDQCLPIFNGTALVLLQLFLNVDFEFWLSFLLFFNGVSFYLSILGLAFSLYLISAAFFSGLL
jgi:hypothetical protein